MAYQLGFVDATGYNLGFIGTFTAGASVSADAAITPGATLAFTATGFGGAITSATLTDGSSNVLTLTGITLVSGDNWTATVPALGDQAYALFGSTTLTVGDGVDTATVGVTLNAPANHAVTTLTSGFATDATTYLYNYTGTPAVGDQFVYPNTILTLNADGTFTTTDSGDFLIHGIDATDGQMQGFNLIVADIIDHPAQVEDGLSYTLKVDVEDTATGLTLEGVAQTINSQTLGSGQTVVDFTITIILHLHP